MNKTTSARSTLRHFALPLAAIFMLGSTPDANAAKSIAWRGGVTKTVIVKPSRVVTVKTVRAQPIKVGRLSRHRHYRGVLIRRHYGHNYWGYGHFHTDSDAFIFLGLTALTLAILDHASEVQQRAHEQAIIEATRARAGETIVWNDGSCSGSVTVLRTGTAANGQPCREFSQAVTIGGKSETAYGVACRQRDGVWRIVN